MIEFTRRHVIGTTISQFLYWCSVLPTLAERAVKESGNGPQKLNWNAFVDRLESTAQTQHRPSWDQAKYTQQVAALARTLNLTDKRLIDERAAYKNTHPFRPEFQDLLQTADVQISLISFERGERIPHHDHPGMTGVTVCAVGDVTVSEYNISPAVRDGGWLLSPAGAAAVVKHINERVKPRTVMVCPKN
jgi:cysteamine dioxygenase